MFTFLRSKRFGLAQATQVFNSLCGKVASEKDAVLVVKTIVAVMGAKLVYEVEAKAAINAAEAEIVEIRENLQAEVARLRAEIAEIEREIRDLEEDRKESLDSIFSKTKCATAEVEGACARQRYIQNVLRFFAPTTNRK